MFSGIIEKTSRVISIESNSGNRIFSIQNVFPDELYIDQSIAHNGVCLTVIDINEKVYKVEAIEETLKVSNLGNLVEGDIVNLERSIRMNDRMDGHIVQGHVDAIAKIRDIQNKEGSWEIKLSIPKAYDKYIIPKGSIALNGISLTLKSVNEEFIEVAIIPYTYEHTDIKNWKAGQSINVEFDMMGKYIVSYMDKINAR